MIPQFVPRGLIPSVMAPVPQRLVAVPIPSVMAPVFQRVVAVPIPSASQPLRQSPEPLILPMLLLLPEPAPPRAALVGSFPQLESRRLSILQSLCSRRFAFTSVWSSLKLKYRPIQGARFANYSCRRCWKSSVGE